MRSANNFKRPRDFFRRLAQDSGARHVRLITLDGTPAIDENDIAFFQFLWLYGAVRQRGRSPQQDKRASVQAHFRKATSHQLADVLLRHAFFDRRKDGAKNVERGFAGQPHELQFVRRLAAAASDGHRIGGNIFESRCGRAQMLEERKRDGFFHADPSSANSTICQRLCGDFRRTLIFLPDVDFRRELQLFAHAALFKSRHDDDGFARAWKQEREKPLAHAPANSREVIKRSSGGHEERLVLRIEIGHQLLSVLEPATILFGGNGMNARAERLEAGESLGESIGFAVRRRSAERREPCGSKNYAAF